MADKLTKKINKMTKKFVKDFKKMNNLSKKSLEIRKRIDDPDKIIIAENIFDRDKKDLKYPPNWKFEFDRGFVYSDNYDTFVVGVEFKHLEKISTAGDVLYELQMSNPKINFKVNENMIEMESFGAELNIDYLLAKGFEKTENGLINKNVLHNGEPIQVQLNKVSELSKESKEVTEIQAGSSMSKALFSTTPDYKTDRVENLDNSLTEGTREKFFNASNENEAVNNEKFNFDRLKYVFTKYALKVINDELVVVDKEDSNKILKDSKLIAETQMAEAWYASCVYGETQDGNVYKDADDASRIDMAFGSRGQDIYETMLNIIEKQVASGEGIDVDKLVYEMNNYQDPERARRIVSALLTNQSPAHEDGFPIKSDKCLHRIKLLLAENLNREMLPEAKDLENDNTPVMEMKKKDSTQI